MANETNDSIFGGLDLTENANEVGRIKRTYTSPYTKKQFQEYQSRLAAVLFREALNTEAIGNDPEAKQFIKTYTEESIIKPKPADLIMGYTYRLANMEIKGFNQQDLREAMSFPVVNKYHGHDLIETIYFKKNPEGGYSIGIVKVIEK